MSVEAHNKLVAKEAVQIAWQASASHVGPLVFSYLVERLR